MLWVEFLHYKKNTMRIITFKSSNCHLSPWFSKLKLFKFNDKVLLENMLLISKFVNSLLPPVLRNWFTYCSNIHYYEKASSATYKLFKTSFRINLYGKNSTTINTIDVWYNAQTSLDDIIFKDLTPNKIKTMMMKRMINS